MSERNFREMLEKQWDQNKFVCVGLDSELDKIPKSMLKNTNGRLKITKTIVKFNQAIVEATKDIVCAYKPNMAFYLKHGEVGMAILQRTIEHINIVAPDVPVILDAKWADIGNTNNGYVETAFDFLQADAVTVHPYLGGHEALQPFLAQKNKGVIVLCRTSNPGAGEFQDALINGESLYHRVARNVTTNWNKNNNCALVVGATYPEELYNIRRLVGDMPILIPGIGFQQKDVPLEEQVKQAVTAGKDSRGKGMVINSSRGIIFASSNPDFAQAARRETQKLHDAINLYRLPRHSLTTAGLPKQKETKP